MTREKLFAALWDADKDMASLRKGFEALIEYVQEQDKRIEALETDLEDRKYAAGYIVG
jgi:hypothetical protein